MTVDNVLGVERSTFPGREYAPESSYALAFSPA